MSATDASQSTTAQENGESMHNLRIEPSRAKVLAENLASIRSRINAAAAATSENSKKSKSPRLICVSKLKPANDILALHQSPLSCLDFGENYAQELTSKAALLPSTIRWHFIGGLQTNKCKPLAAEVKNLWCVSSVDSAKKADALDKGRAELRAKTPGGLETLRVQVQVNTSGEAQKSGVEPGKEAIDLCRHIRESCQNLDLTGLMTIGAIARSQEAQEGSENEDFIALKKARDEVVEALGLQEADLELGMGMSADFESAIRLGSDEVRVGSSLFGERPAKKDAKLTEGQDGNTATSH